MMIRNLKWLSTAIGVLFYSCTTLATERVQLTPENLPQLLQEKNQNISAAKLITEASQTRTGHFSRSFLPVITGSAGVETFHTGQYHPTTQPFGLVEAKINLFQGGRDRSEESIRLAQVQAFQALEKRTKQQELHEARKNYWQLVYNREILDILKTALVQNEKYQISVNQRANRGLTSRTDRLEFELNGSKIKEEIESLEHEDRILRNLFDGGQSRVQANVFSFQSEAYSNQATQRARQIDAQFRVAQEEMKHSHELILKVELRIEQSRVYLKNTLDEYDRGVKNSSDVFGASEKVLSILKHHVELKRDYRLARSELLSILGE